jgi:hypothetical protein
LGLVLRRLLLFDRLRARAYLAVERKFSFNIAFTRPWVR